MLLACVLYALADCKVEAHMDALTLFGKRIRAVREAAGISREVVAERAKTTPNYLGEIERGEKWPALELIVSLANALSVSPDVLFQFEAEEVDTVILHSKLQEILATRNTTQLQQALRVLKSLFQL